MYKREKKTLMFVLQTLFVICSYLFFVCAFIPALAKGRLFEILKNCCNMRKFLMADKIFRAVASFLYFLWQLLFCSLSFTHVYFRFCFVFPSTWGICSIWFHFVFRIRIMLPLLLHAPLSSYKQTIQTRIWNMVSRWCESVNVIIHILI